MVDVQTLLEAFLNLSQSSASFTDEAFFWKKAKLPVLELFSSSARLSGFPDCWMFGLRDFTVFTCTVDPQKSSTICSKRRFDFRVKFPHKK